MPVKGTYLLAAGGGAILLWSGLRGHRWSTVLRDVISGKQVPTTQELAIQTAPSAFTSSGTSSNTSNLTGSNLVTSIGGSRAKNMAIGATLATRYGWAPGTSNWKSLVALWDGESGWDNRAVNPGSGALGIPQALPPTKMPKLAQSPFFSATVQIAWGLKYIKQVYGNPDTAYRDWLSRSPHWY